MLFLKLRRIHVSRRDIITILLTRQYAYSSMSFDEEKKPSPSLISMYKFVLVRVVKNEKEKKMFLFSPSHIFFPFRK